MLIQELVSSILDDGVKGSEGVVVVEDGDVT